MLTANSEGGFFAVAGGIVEVGIGHPVAEVVLPVQATRQALGAQP
jgi:hypothetical protein